MGREELCRGTRARHRTPPILLMPQLFPNLEGNRIGPDLKLDAIVRDRGNGVFGNRFARLQNLLELGFRAVKKGVTPLF